MPQIPMHSRQNAERAQEPEGEGDKKWDALLARVDAQALLVEMAREARADFYAGRTTEIEVTGAGRLAPK